MAEPITDMNYAGGGLLLPVPDKHPPIPDHAMPSGHFMHGGIMHDPNGKPIAKQDGPVMRKMPPQHFMSGGLAGPNPSTNYADGGLALNRTGFVNKGIPYAKGGMVNSPDWATAAGDNGGLEPPTLSYANGGPAGGVASVLDEIPGYGEDTGGFAGAPTPNQKNGWSGTVGSVIGSLVGDYFGGPAGGLIGGKAGKQGGDEFGNIIAGRDAFNGGTGDFWDNLNPLSKDGAASIGQSLDNAQASMQMPQQMMGGLGGGLPGMGGGLPGMGGGLPGGNPLQGLGLAKGGSVGYAEGGATDMPPTQQEQQGQQAPANPNDPNAQIAQNAMPAENKADNIPAKLSKGEFVMDAATVMYFGVGKLQKMQEQAHTAIADHIAKQQQKQGLGSPQQQQAAPQQAAPNQPMLSQLPPQAAPQQNATQARIAQTAQPPVAPKPSSPFSLMG